MKMNRKLIDELRAYHGANGSRVCIDTERLALTKQLKKDMDDFAAAHPAASVYALRGRIYDLVAEQFRPVLFPHSPFYAELGGNGGWNNSGLGRWLLEHNDPMFRDADPAAWERFVEQGAGRQRYFLCCGPYFDASHNSPPFSNLLKKGFKGIYDEAREARNNCRTPEETEFVECAIKGLLAVKTILERYAETARERLRTAADPEEIGRAHV